MKRTQRPSSYQRAERAYLIGGMALMAVSLALLAAMPWLFPALAGAVH